MNRSAQLEQRAVEPVVQCLVRHLMVPDIYIEPSWPTHDQSIDLLLIDRAGTGDVHIVEVKQTAKDAVAAIGSLMQVPAHYRWVAVLAGAATLVRARALYPSEGAGRIGVIEVVRMGDGDLRADIRLKAERFHKAVAPGDKKHFVETNKPDITFD